jgi:hypothetical protein
MKKFLIILLLILSCSSEEAPNPQVVYTDSCMNDVCQRCRYVDGKFDACWTVYSFELLGLDLEMSSEGGDYDKM